MILAVNVSLDSHRVIIGMSKEDSVLKYESVADDIVQKISAGNYRPNDKLPTTEELCEQYQVSKITIKKAMDELEQRGLVARRRGSGTFVKGIVPVGKNAPEGWSMSSQMTGFKNEALAEGHTPSTKVVEFAVEHPDAMVAEALGLDADEFVYRICRVRLRDDVPLVIEHTWMPINVIPDLRMKHLEDSIYNYIENDLGLKIASAHRTAEAVGVSEEEAPLLDVPAGSPCLQVEQVGFLDDGQPFEYSISRHVRGYKLFTISTH